MPRILLLILFCTTYASASTITLGSEQALGPAARGATLASSGKQSFVVWVESRPNTDGTFSYIVFGAFLAADASRISDPIPIGNGDAADVIALGDEYMVAWSATVPGGHVLAFRRVRADGSLTDARTVWQAEGLQPHIATNGKIVVIAFSRTGGAMQAVRVSTTGDLLDTIPLTIAIVAGLKADVMNSAIASNGDSFLVAFSTNYKNCLVGGCAYPNSQVLAVRLDSSGNVIDQAPIAVTTGRSYPDGVILSGAASDGRDYLIVYREPRGAFAKRVLREGVLADTIASEVGTLVERPTQGVTPTAVLQHAATGYLVFVSDPLFNQSRIVRTDLMGDRVDDVVSFAGVVVDSVADDRDFVVVYTRPDAAGVTRLFARTVSVQGPRVRSVRRRY